LKVRTLLEGKQLRTVPPVSKDRARIVSDCWEAKNQLK
jgi:hypothetical protein